MVDEDLALRRREITGETVQLCDLCGAPIAGQATVFEQAEFPPGHAAEGMILCDECRREAERGEIDLIETAAEPRVPVTGVELVQHQLAVNPCLGAEP